MNLRANHGIRSATCHFPSREYNPTAGRFLSPDPLGHKASWDLYSYAGGDPINYIDCTGRSLIQSVQNQTLSPNPPATTNLFGVNPTTGSVVPDILNSVVNPGQNNSSSVIKTAGTIIGYADNTATVVHDTAETVEYLSTAASLAAKAGKVAKFTDAASYATGPLVVISDVMQHKNGEALYDGAVFWAGISTPPPFDIAVGVAGAIVGQFIFGEPQQVKEEYDPKDPTYEGMGQIGDPSTVTYGL